MEALISSVMVLMSQTFGRDWDVSLDGKTTFKNSVFSLGVVLGFFFYRLIYRFRPPAVIIADCVCA